MADETIARLIAVLEVELKSFQRGMEQAQRIADQRFGAIEQRMRQTEDSFSSGFKKLGELTAGFLSVAAITSFVKSISEAAEVLTQLSNRTGVSVENLQKLEAAGRAVNISTSELDNSLQQFAKNLGLAERGQGQLAKVMKDTGLTSGKDLVETFLNLADVVHNAKTIEEQFTITQAALGRGSLELVGLLRQGAGALREQMDAFKSGLSNETVKSLAEFAKHWKEIQISLTNLGAGVVARIFDGWAEFLHEVESGTWLERLQTAARMFTLGLVPQPAVGAWDKQNQQLDQLQAKLKGLQIQRAGEQSPGKGPGILGNLTSQLDADIASTEEKIAALKNLMFSHPTGVDLGSGKPAGALGFEGDTQAAAKEVARTLSTLKAAQASLAQATSAANAEQLRDTDAYYAKVREGADITAKFAIAAARERGTAEIAALNEANVGTTAFAESKINILKRVAVEESEIEQKRKFEIAKIDEQELTTKRAASERLVAIEQQRAEQLARISEGASAAARDLVAATAATNLEQTRGTPQFFDVARKAIEDEAAAQRAVVRENEKVQLESLERLRIARFKQGEDGITVDADFGQKQVLIRQETADKLLTIEQQTTEKTVALREEQTRVRETAIQASDAVRTGLEDIGVAATHGFKSFKDAAKQALVQVTDLIVQLYIMRPLVEGLLGRQGTTGGGALGGILKDIGSIFGFAGGGRPQLGKISIVGERGPELFVPDTAGKIVPIPPQVSARGMSLNVSAPVYVSLDGANGDMTIAAFAKKGAELGAATAIKTIKAQFPAMVADYNKRWG